MISSVWNYGSRSYDYYEGPGDGKSHAGVPPRARGAAAIGATPEQAAWRVPAGARRVGSGPMPKGRIASLGGDAGGIDIPPTALLVAGGVAAYLWWKRKSR